MNVREEILALARHQGMDTGSIRATLDELAADLERYTEIVITETGIEVVTGGAGRQTADRLAAIARAHDLPLPAIELFLACHRAFPEAFLGLKLCWNSGGPTLYVRTAAPRDRVLSFLEGWTKIRTTISKLRKELDENETLYGLGFFGDENGIGVKTYTLSDLPGTTGFVSHRIRNGNIFREEKIYRPEVPWSFLELPEGRWQELVNFAATVLGYSVAGHVGVTQKPGHPAEYKIYVERIGAIPTDFALR